MGRAKPARSSLSWVLNLCFFLLVSTRRQLVDAWTYLMLAINVLFFAGISLFIENPFARVWQLADGSLAEGLLHRRQALLFITA